jgi:hypothetical protein
MPELALRRSFQAAKEHMAGLLTIAGNRALLSGMGFAITP